MRGLISLVGSSCGLETVYVCGRCGFMHFYSISADYDGHRLTEPEQPPERIECLVCGELIAEEDASCPSCGWTWTSERAVRDDGDDDKDS